MNIGNIATIVIPLAVFGYALWLVIRRIRNRKESQCSLGGCAGCPFREGCETAKQPTEKEKQRNEEGHHE